MLFFYLSSCPSFLVGNSDVLQIVDNADGNKYKGSIYMVFEYMDHDLTGLADRPGMRFTVPQIKVLNKACIILCSLFILLPTDCLLLLFGHAQSVLHEAAANRSSLLSCQSSAPS